MIYGFSCAFCIFRHNSELVDWESSIWLDNHRTMSHRGRGRRLKYSDYKPPNVELFREHDAARRYYEHRGMAVPAKSVPADADSLPASVPDSPTQFANPSSAFAAGFTRLPEIIPKNNSSSSARASCSVDAATSDGSSLTEAGRENASPSCPVIGGQLSVDALSFYPTTWKDPKDIEVISRNSESDSVSDPSNGDSGIEDPSVKHTDDDVGQEDEKIQQPNNSTIPPFRRLGELRSLMGMPQLYQEDPQKVEIVVS